MQFLTLSHDVCVHTGTKEDGAKGQTHLVQQWDALIERRIDSKRLLSATNGRLTWVC